ncbi:MAG TPA: hypothetical protein VMQ54_11230, partial [Steroidobacteraceae bacterium]|nr:hypothetical protein [Steroidobacteraceae bacterium]
MTIASQSAAAGAAPQAAGSAQAGATVSSPRAPLSQEFDGLARLAANLCQTPLASIVLLGSGQSWCGADEAPLRSLTEHDPFFEYTSRAAELFEVPDTAVDERFRSAACAQGTLPVRWYLGCALRTAGGDLLGTLAVYATTVRQLSTEQRASP